MYSLFEYDSLFCFEERTKLSGADVSFVVAFSWSRVAGGHGAEPVHQSRGRSDILLLRSPSASDG